MTTPSGTEAVSSTYESLLGGVTDPDGREILDPATGEVVGRAPVRSVAEDLDAAVAPRPRRTARVGGAHRRGTRATAATAPPTRSSGGRAARGAAVP